MLLHLEDFDVALNRGHGRAQTINHPASRDRRTLVGAAARARIGLRAARP
jgi:hypothetical protein